MVSRSHNITAMMNKYHHRSHWFLVLALLFLTACGGKTNTIAIDPDLNVAQEYLERAKNAKGAERVRWLLSAAEALYEGQRPEKALSILQQINQNELTPIANDWYLSLLGRGLSSAERYDDAITQFRAVTDISRLNVSRQINYHDYFANTLDKQERHFEAAKQRISHLALVTDDLEVEAVKELLWQHLLAIPNPAIYQTSLNSRLVEGWLDLAIIAQTYPDQPEDLIRALEIWTSRYQTIIPDSHLPLDLSRALAVEIYQPSRLAVLLPLTGQLASSSEQIRRGIMAAHFASESDIELLFLDTNNTDIQALYQQAIDLNSQFVLGPLRQSEVTQLAESEYLSIPILAINRLSVDDIQLPENFYQFGLPIEDEVNLIANHILNKGEERGLLLLPDNSNGDRALREFESVFNLQDADIQRVVRYQQGEDYAKPVQEMLGVDQSIQRHRRLEQLTGVSMEFQARRRQDIDFIFFIADPATGRRIKPFIDFYYAHDVAKYATSRIYRGVQDEVLDNDLNNVQFPTIPFLVTESQINSDLRNALNSQWQDSKEGIAASLFALGYDSYQIIPELSKLRYFPNYRLKGMSGQLSVNEQGHVLRELPWARFTNGKAEITALEGPDVAPYQDTSSP